MQAENLIPASEFCLHHYIEISFIYSLEDYGLIVTKQMEGTCFIDAAQLAELEKLVRLHYDLHINLEGIDAIRHLLQQLETMEGEIVNLKNRLRFYEKE